MYDWSEANLQLSPKKQLSPKIILPPLHVVKYVKLAASKLFPIIISPKLPMNKPIPKEYPLPTCCTLRS